MAAGGLAGTLLRSSQLSSNTSGAGGEEPLAKPLPAILVGGSQYDSWWPTWRPRAGGVLLASLREHSGAVNKLAVSQDQVGCAPRRGRPRHRDN